MKTYETEAYSAYDQNFNYIPSGVGKLTNPEKTTITDFMSEELKHRFKLYSDRD